MADVEFSTSVLPGGQLGVTVTVSIRTVASALLVAGGLTLAPSTATATPTPASTPAVFGNLLAVSCTSPSFCMAVGYKEDDYGRDRAMAYVSNGSAWHEVPTPEPPVTFSNDRMVAVGCSAPNSCYGVGFQAAGSPYIISPTQISAEHWDGRRWSATPIQRPGSATVDGVSCSAGTCVAVGQHAGVAGPAAQSWVLRGGSFVLTPLAPSPYPASALTSVSCMSATSCNAAGRITIDGRPLIEHWDGRQWTSFGVATLPGLDGSSRLTSISCPVVGSCVAVGSTFGGSRFLVLNRANGGPWKVGMPGPPDAWGAEEFSSVACLSAQVCAGIGTFDEGLDHHEELAWRGYGTGPFIFGYPCSHAPCYGPLNAVSCIAGVCVYVGYGSAARGTGLAPRKQLVPDPLPL